MGYEEMLKELDLSHRRRFLGNIIAAFSYLEGRYRADRPRLFSETPRKRTSGNSSNTVGAFEERKKLLTIRIVQLWPKELERDRQP